MTTSASSPQARATLRRLTAPHAIDFSARLLQRSERGVLTFRAFVHTARELVREQPERCATYLAALVALDAAVASAVLGPAAADPPLPPPIARQRQRQGQQQGAHDGSVEREGGASGGVTGTQPQAAACP